jgi:tRNA nucleotidyltransferase (CCA-adding enzyme)
MQQNLRERLRLYLPARAWIFLQKVGKTADAEGMKAYLVGGVVRDFFMRRKSDDIDIVVEGDAIKFASRLKLQSGMRIMEHPAFGTVKFSLQGLKVDIASARHESYARPGALPSVEPGCIGDDLARRDFTINSMAICLNQVSFGELLDFFGGMRDLRCKYVRILHDKSFIDDATRILRAIRYEQRLRFKIESQTLRLLHGDLQRLNNISGDRIRNELYLMLGEDVPERSIHRAHELGVLRQINPALVPGEWLARSYKIARKYHRRHNRTDLYLCLLVYAMELDDLKIMQQRLKFPRRKLELLTKTLELKPGLKILSVQKLKPFQIYSLLRNYPSVAAEAAALAVTSARVQARINRYLKKWRKLKPPLKGEELIAEGIAEGPLVKVYLDALLEARINGKISGRAEARQLLHKMLHKKTPVRRL